MKHVPVLLEETISLLDQPGIKTVVDATVGGGGHAEALLSRFGRIDRLLGIDRDAQAVQRAGDRLARFGSRVTMVKASFAEIGEVLDRMGIGMVDAVLMDLGVSSFQLEDAARGFSFMKDGPLDMRMDKDQKTTAAHMVNGLSEQELASIFFEYGEERHSRRIARAILRQREQAPIQTTLELAKTVAAVSPRGGSKIHPATRVFQALRIAVNGEIEKLRPSIEGAVARLNPGGRIAVITFHSLEDRIVKNTFADLAGRCVCPRSAPVCVCGAKGVVSILTKKPLAPSDEEVGANPRARSAKLRAAEKLAA